MLDPGPDFSKTPAQTIEVLRALRALQALDRPMLLAVSRKDFVGALTGRGPARAAGGHAGGGGARRRRRRAHAAGPRCRRDGRLPRRARGAERRAGGRPGAAASDDAALGAGPTTPDAVPSGRPASLDTLRIAGRWPNATGAHRSSHERSSQCPYSTAARSSSPLADLHAIASELSIDGYRRLAPGRADRRDPRQAGRRRAVGARRRRCRRRPTHDEAERDEDVARDEASHATRTRARDERWARDEDGTATRTARDERRGTRRRCGRDRRRRGRRPRDDAADGADGRGRNAARGEASGSGPSDGAEPAEEPEAGDEEQLVEGVVELLANGSGFVRVSRPTPSDDDVYISAAQVKRCELVAGDRVSGPEARAAPLRALRVADPDRDDQRPSGLRARRQRPLRRPAGGVRRPSGSCSAPRTRRSRRSSG